MGDRYVVTGGAGFVGSNLVAALVRHDPSASICIVDDCRTGSFANVIEAMDRAKLPPFSGRFIASPFEQLNAADDV